jgi:hypothetical protein
VGKDFTSEPQSDSDSPEADSDPNGGLKHCTFEPESNSDLHGETHSKTDTKANAKADT